MGKWCLHASSFIFDLILFILAGNEDIHKISDKFEFRPDQTTVLASSFIFDRIIIRTGIKAWMSSILGLWLPWPIYMSFEMRFDLGVLDSGERLLPFGLLVIQFKLDSNPLIFFFSTFSIFLAAI